MKQRITIADVAKEAGVSKQTVSRAINDKGEISPATKARIMQVIAELGYRPNRMAQAMNTNESLMVGLVVITVQGSAWLKDCRSQSRQT